MAGLESEDVNNKITDKHIEVISRSSCKKWIYLPAHLELDSIIAEDIDGLPVDEDKKRHKFFSTWKEKKGSEATYKTLIGALLTIECKEDAEYVLKLLKGVDPAVHVQPQQLQQQQQQPEEQPCSLISDLKDTTGTRDMQSIVRASKLRELTVKHTD